MDAALEAVKVADVASIVAGAVALAESAPSTVLKGAGRELTALILGAVLRAGAPAPPDGLEEVPEPGEVGAVLASNPALGSALVAAGSGSPSPTE